MHFPSRISRLFRHQYYSKKKCILTGYKLFGFHEWKAMYNLEKKGIMMNFLSEREERPARPRNPVGPGLMQVAV